MNARPLTRLEWVEQRLRRAIITGELQPGERLKTEELASAWGVSSTPFRESYQKLAAEGLVDLIPQRGARVTQVNAKEAAEIYELRLLLEPYALRRSLEGRDQEWEKRVGAAFEELRTVLEESPDDVLEFERAHGRFDEALLSGYTSSWLSRIIRTVRDHSMRYRIFSVEAKGGVAEILAQHQALYEACVHGEIEEAVDLFTHHLTLTLDSFTKVSSEQIIDAALSNGAGSSEPPAVD